jgi:hypothetical protein
MEIVMKKQDNVVELKRLLLKRFDVYLMGSSPLIMNKWSQKAKEQMLAKQMKKASTGKQAKDPQRDFEESIYVDRAGMPSFPSVAFKASAVDAAQAMEFKKTNLRQSFHIEGDMVPIIGSDPEPREDMVRVGMGTADIRFRAQFPTWGTVLPVVINTAMISPEQLINLFDAAGFGIGVGEWRPQRDGQFGRFKIASAEEEKQIKGWMSERAKKAKAA